MPAETTTPRLTEKFREALTYAAAKHHRQTRKGGDIPYIGHLLSVAGLVIEADGTETQAIAALLHDAAEDQGGKETLDEINSCSVRTFNKSSRNAATRSKTPNLLGTNEKSYIDHLNDVSPDTILVSLADKVDNARAMLRDFRQTGSELWQRFSVKDPEDHLWYYRSLLAAYKQRTDSWLVDVLRRNIDELAELVNA